MTPDSQQLSPLSQRGLALPLAMFVASHRPLGFFAAHGLQLLAPLATLIGLNLTPYAPIALEQLEQRLVDSEAGAQQDR